MPYTISDHYDGEHFFNPEPTTRTISDGKRRRGILSILASRFLRRGNPEGWSAWPKHVANTAYPLPPAPTGGQMQATFIGHACYLIRLPGITILTDPVFSERCSPVRFAGPKRARAPGIALDALPAIDLILLSHNHYDHMDIVSLRRLRRRFRNVPIVTGLGNAAYLAGKRIGGASELDWWQSKTVGEAVITATPARHFAARTLRDRNKTLWCGFMLDYRGHKIYFAGDSGYTRFFGEIASRLGAPDLAFLPIGAYEPRWFMGVVHMNPADAVQALQDLGASHALGMHYGTFQLTAEAIDAPPAELAKALAAANIPPERFVAPDTGETKVF